MRLFIFCVMLGFLSQVPLRAQTVLHTKWKGYYPSIRDTVTLSFEDDSASVVTPTTVPVLRSGFKFKGGLIIFHDAGGMSGCRDLGGSYHVRISADTLTLVMAEDPCDGRAGVLIIKPWIRVR